MAYPILAPRDSWFTQGGSGIKRSTITEIHIKDSYTPGGPVTAQWDGSAAKDGSITVYVEGATLTIAGNGSGKIQLSPDASLTFSGDSFDDIYKAANAVIGLDLLDTANVTEAMGFFRYMASVKELDVSGFRMGKCRNFNHFFAGYPSPQIGTMSLTKIIGIESLDVSAAENLASMFYFCTELTDLPIGGWKTGRCQNFSAIIGECHKLQTSKVIENWDVSSGIYFSHMLCDNYAMTGTLDLSGWNMAKAQDVSALINDCSSLEALNISGWDGTNIRALAQMCERCRGLKNIIGLGGLKTPNASLIKNPQFANQTAFTEMLSGCEAVEELDFSNIDTRATRKTYTDTMNDMLSGMLRLRKVTLGPNFDWTGGKPTDPPAGTDIPVLPTPDPTYIPGADGLWYDASGTAYTPEDAVKTVPNTYYGSLELARKEPAMLENGTMMDIGQAIQDRSGSLDKHMPRAMAAAIRSIPSGGDIGLGMTGATVGQIARIRAVGADGKPTEWEPVDMPSGGIDGEYVKIETIKAPGDGVPIVRTAEPDGRPYNFKALIVKVHITDMDVESFINFYVGKPGSGSHTRLTGIYTGPAYKNTYFYWTAEPKNGKWSIVESSKTTKPWGQTEQRVWRDLGELTVGGNVINKIDFGILPKDSEAIIIGVRA